jgi:TDG/mug DNA glycosylase family protein
MTTVLPDILKPDLQIVFCGTAAGDKSAERKAYYAGRGNLFYFMLVTCGFTSSLFEPEQFPNLVQHQIGLTDLAKQAHGMDKDLKSGDYDTDSFEEKILKFHPKIVCFNGKEAAKVYFKLKETKQVSYGLQGRMIGKTKLYVAPSTSFSARKYWDDNYYKQLKTFIQ